MKTSGEAKRRAKAVRRRYLAKSCGEAKPLGGDLRVSMTAALPKAVETGLAIDDAQGWAQDSREPSCDPLCDVKIQSCP